MSGARGYAILTSAAGTREWDSFTCCHCQRVVFVQAKQDPASIGGFCRMCMKLTCPACEKVGLCIPFERKLDFIESQGLVRRGLSDDALELVRREFPIGGR